MNCNYFSNDCADIWELTYRAHMSVRHVSVHVRADGWISLRNCSWFQEHSSVLMNTSAHANTVSVKEKKNTLSGAVRQSGAVQVVDLRQDSLLLRHADIRTPSALHPHLQSALLKLVKSLLSEVFRATYTHIIFGTNILGWMCKILRGEQEECLWFVLLLLAVVFPGMLNFDLWCLNTEL